MKRRITVVNGCWEHVGIDNNGVIISTATTNCGKEYSPNEDEELYIWFLVSDAAQGIPLVGDFKVSIEDIES